MEVVGTETKLFSLPVCNAFEKTILDGRLCYQIDVDRFVENITTSAENLRKVGLSLLVDVNAEYDISKIFRETEETIFKDITEEFVRLEESDNFMIHLDTNSMIYFTYNERSIDARCNYRLTHTLTQIQALSLLIVIFMHLYMFPINIIVEHCILEHSKVMTVSQRFATMSSCF